MSRYRILSLINSGTYCNAYLAFDEELRRNICLKLIKPSILRTDNNSLILEEARILAKLNHPNIVTVYDAFEYQNTIALAMEHLEGDTLQQALETGSIKGSALDIAYQLAKAIQEIHAHDIIHGDIKPSNIVFDAQGHIKVIDFGLSFTANPITNFPTINQEEGENHSTLKGTLPYLAPEVISGHKQGKASDIFALGAVFYEIFVGRPAFSANHEAALLQEILNKKITEASLAEVVDIPTEMAQLICQMMAKNNRISSVDLVVNQLEELRQPLAHKRREPTTGTSNFWGYLNSFSRKKSVLHSLLVVSAFALLAFFGPNIENRFSISRELTNGFNLLENYQVKGNLKKAKVSFENILLHDPENTAATAGMSLTFLRLYTSHNSDPQYYNQALKTAELALVLDPNLALSQLAMGKVLRKGGKFSEALKYYKKTLELDPKNEDANIELAYLHKATGNVKLAISHLKNLNEVHPNKIAYIDELGVFYFMDGRLSMAEEKFRQSIEIYPDNPMMYANLSAVEHAQGNTPQAISTLQRGLSIHPHLYLYSNLGTYFFYQKQYSQAAAAFEHALEFPGGNNDYRIWANLADSYEQVQSKQQETTAAYQRALQLLQKQNPVWEKDAQLVTRVALYQAKIGSHTAALQTLNLLEQQESIPPDILFNQIRVRAVINQNQEALHLLKQLVADGYSVQAIENTTELFNLRQTPEYHLIMSFSKKGS